MKTHYLSLLMLACLSIFNACKKEDAADPFPKVRTRVDELGYTYTYTYRGDGKLINVKGSDGYKEEHSYTGNKIAIEFTSGTDIQVTPTQIEYILNDKNLVASYKFGTNSVTTFEYNSDNKLIRSTSSFATEVFEWENGNLTKSTATNINGDITITSSIYYTDKDNKLNDKVYGLDFFGNDSKNLIKSRTTTHNGQADVSNYSYEFDNKGRVTKQIEDRGVVVRINTFTYY